MLNSMKRKSTKPAKPEVHELKAAYIIPKEEGDKMIQTLAELPIKYSQLIGPMIDKLQKAFRGDTTVTVSPNKQPLPEIKEK